MIDIVAVVNKYDDDDDDLGTSVELNEIMRATPMSTVNHENNVLVLLLLHYYRVAQKIWHHFFCTP